MYLNLLYTCTVLCYQMCVYNRSGKSDELKARADLITAYTHSWTEKSPRLQCYDFETGEPVTIELPLGEGPSEYAERMYRKARKLKRSVAVLDNLVKKVKYNAPYYLFPNFFSYHTSCSSPPS
jgi:predicted ribosome quality control (RQC) complex YloA/Tae2 family protein